MLFGTQKLVNGSKLPSFEKVGFFMWGCFWGVYLLLKVMFPPVKKSLKSCDKLNIHFIC